LQFFGGAVKSRLGLFEVLDDKSNASSQCRYLRLLLHTNATLLQFKDAMHAKCRPPPKLVT